MTSLEERVNEMIAKNRMNKAVDDELIRLSKEVNAHFEKSINKINKEKGNANTK
jgi:hypothetical protein